MVSLFDLTGRTALVTGASRGLGAAAAEILAEAGTSVALIGREMDTLRASEEKVQSYGAETLAVRCDMSNPQDVQRAVAETRERFGSIDILVNNAGIIRRSPAENYSLDDWNAVMSVNATGPFLMAQEVAHGMLEQGSGKIINIASLLSFSGGLNVVAYTASKSALAGITRALANEWGRRGINVNAIAPGYFHTEATSALRDNPERYNALLARIPAGRWGDPEDLKGAILFLASRASDYVHGHILAVDGGWMAG